ncbi:Nuclear cap-binding protein subunit 1 [Elasticomyces elasticus]|nr:Nuclear cap-binding protein subunit 1 [Elasticomyces elasticus]KAK3619428.1 Nuclear cap-binding protein subunit 1 [Elasticomyces elasticus]KAK4897660.1 Nuclear cap-binding protein subunit 1 [Elasticomyces elasticus]KAK5733873.1 Nuclear cap-binding protein subunit 1 [Elasticomyces elasticus]
MADTDTRRDYGGGGGFRQNGGGGRGGYGNKRKRGREDDDFEQGRPDRRPRHSEPPPGTRLRRALLEIGDDPLRLPQEVAQNAAKLAAENYEDEFVRDTFSTIALKLAVEQPFKIPIIAGVIQYANAENSEVAKDVISKAGPQLQEYLDAGQWREFKLMLRLVACLSPLYEEDGVLPMLDELFNRAVDLQTATPEDTVGLELVKIILLTIPYLLAANPDAALQQATSVFLERTEIIASAPNPLEPLVDPYPDNNAQDERPMACSSVISLLQLQLRDEESNGWPLKCIPRVYDPNFKQVDPTSDATEEANGNGEMKEPTKHSFPSIVVPATINPGLKALFPDLYFSLFADQEIESVPSTTSIAACVIRDAILDTVNILDFNRNATARFLNDIDCYWSPDTFVKRATAFDKLRDMPAGKPTWKPEDVIIDAIFSQIFQLPTPEHRLVYYHSLITESCKISPGAIAPSLGRAIRFLFRAVDSMDMELMYRFMDWFGHHLSNFEFRWKWAEWIPELELSTLSPKKAFIIGTLEKEIQLSFAKRVRDTLPTDYHPLIPASKENEVPQFKYNDDTIPYAKEGREVLLMLRKKSAEEDIQTVLTAVQEQATAHGVHDPLVPSTDIYMTSILSIGSKSLSHVLSTIDRCKDRLLAVGSQSELARRQIITSVVDFWADHPGTAVNIVDKLLNYTIVTPMAVVQWALQDRIDRGRALASLQTYELVSITMFKVTNRVRQVLRERNNMNLPYEQRQQIDDALPRERQGMRDLFAAIEDAVAVVAAGAQDEMVERYDDGSAEEETVKMWGQKWLRVWRRKAAVEEAVVGEANIGPLEEPVPEAVVEDDGDMDQVS